MDLNKKEISALYINGKAVQQLFLNGKSVMSGEKIDISNFEIEAVYSRVLYTGEPVTAWIEVTDPHTEEHLVQDRDFTVEYVDNVEVGTAKAKAIGMGRYTGETSVSFEIMSNDVSTEGYDITISPTVFEESDYPYDVTVEAIDSTGTHMTQGEDYTVENDHAGNVTITGVGKYVGYVDLNYEIESGVDYLTFTSVNGGGLGLYKEAGSPPDVTLEYKVDGSWQPYTLGETITVDEGQSVKFRGNNDTFSTGKTSWYKFKMTGDWKASGNIMTLLDKTGLRTNLPDYSFTDLFYGQTGLVDAGSLRLPATTLGTEAYYEMFASSGITACPQELPAEYLTRGGEYQKMFKDCASLENPPEIKVRQIAGSYNMGAMFSGSGIVNAPVMDVELLSGSSYVCQQLFLNCTNLVDASMMTVRGIGGQYSFQHVCAGCTNLEKIPNTMVFMEASSFNGAFQRTSSLKDVELKNYGGGNNCYYYAFQDSGVRSLKIGGFTVKSQACRGICERCTSLQKLEVDVASTSSTGSQGWYWAFNGCSNLNEVKVGTDWTTWPSNLGSSGLGGWLEGVAANGTFICPPELPIERGKHRIPQNWEVRRNSEEFLVYTIDGNTSISFNRWASVPTVNLQYSYNGEDWERLYVNGTINLSNPGDYAYIRALPGSPNENGFCTAQSNGNYYFIDTADSGRWGMAGKLDCLINSDEQAESLPAYCYFHLFNGMNKLVDLSGLRITNRYPGDYSYYLAFSNCPNLVSGPYFEGTEQQGTLAFMQMFSGCSALNSLEVEWYQWPDREKLSGWLEGVSSTGDFRGPEGLVPETGTGRIPIGWTFNGQPIPDMTPYLTFTAEQPNTKISLTGSDKSLEFSTDGETWQAWDQTTGTVLENVGDYLKLRSTVTRDTMGGSKFEIDGLAAASGELKSIYDRTLAQAALGSQGARTLFQSCYGLTEAPELTWTTIGQQAYEATFGDCTNLRKIRGRLTATGNLYMTCGYMFSGCTSLVDVPYDWFGGDGSFTAQRWGIAYMFANCGITKAPLCNFNVQNADNAATNLFNGCGNLNEIHVTWTSWPAKIDSWVSGVSTTGTFYKPSALPEEYGVNRIPTGWTVVNE